MQKVKLTFIGDVKVSPKSGKNLREIGAEEFNGEKKAAFDRTCDAFAPFKVGDEVEVEVSENGKYINKVSKVGAVGNPTAGYGGKGFVKGSYSKAPDPEKDIAIYTRYCLDTVLQGYTKDPKVALDLVFSIKEQVKGRL